MKQYKHKQTKLIATQMTVNYKVGELEIPGSIVENSNDWEEIIKKNYEILDAHYACLGKVVTNIRKVKRLSDGEVFSIGDKCNEDIIKEFKIFDNGARLYVVSENRTWGLNIDMLIKDKKQPLFITEDGIDIYEGNEIFIVNKSFNIGFSKGVKYNNHKDNKFFSSLESVQNYILENKPCLSLKDVKDCYNFAPKNSPLYDDLINNLELKVKEKNV
jgi:hypothetical protein